MSKPHGEYRESSGARGGMSSWAIHGVTVCPRCGGSGIVASPAWRERARKGGVESYLVSVEPGSLSMRERGQRGGRPRALTIENIKERKQPRRARLIESQAGPPPDEASATPVRVTGCRQVQENWLKKLSRESLIGHVVSKT